ncbi:hypothetical protein PILCRDRAFT_825992 [Piloderma croceum F 1598]|uniref:Uncharacterized protein n=1 Tax=Piloderma croceum (strain F 1598) TaxID=765440 RepID=A0A0C3AS70_PILCF|nr:hypothetical protein PILCRDRAFT_825992 [Piloderma croceum F 1598]
MSWCIRSNAAIAYDIFKVLTLSPGDDQLKSLQIMKFPEFASLFLLSWAICSSASIIRRDPVCVGEGFPCQNLIPGVLVCCDGLGCDTILGLAGFVGLAS